MLANISRFFEQYLKPCSPSQETEQEHLCKLQLASATLMIELCKSDNKVCEDEMSKILAILESRFELSRETLDQLVSLAEQEAREATSLFQFTSLINDGYGYQEKLELLHNMWEVAYADGNLDRYEEHMIRRVADLLYISHSDFIRSKLSARPM